MSLLDKNISELKAMCKERNIKGIAKKTKNELIKLLEPINCDILQDEEKSVILPEGPEVRLEHLDNAPQLQLRQEVICGDSMTILPTLESESAQIIIADPPYNIGKDFGNDSDKQTIEQYLAWCKKWIAECIRILKSNGTMFIYGFSENLALILSQIPYNINRRWIIWHYTNKNVASLNFWQRSHESILVLWKSDKIFHRDDVREAYTESFLNNVAGKERKETKGRFSKGDKKTTYNAHPNGALPRDVIKIPALAGGAGMNERVNHPTQKPLSLCDKLIRSCKTSDGYVLVPFAGSGSECVAAKNLNLPFIGIEINKEYVDIIKDRLNGTKKVNAEV